LQNHDLVGALAEDLFNEWPVFSPLDNPIKKDPGPLNILELVGIFDKVNPALFAFLLPDISDIFNQVIKVVPVPGHDINVEAHHIVVGFGDDGGHTIAEYAA
jgi:hypothetical protein